MALITCPECGRKVSDRAKACPECGFPVAEYVIQENVPNVAEVKTESNESNPKLTKQEKQEVSEKVPALKNVKRFPLLGREVAFDKDILKVNELHRDIMTYVWNRRTEFVNYYNANVHKFDDLFSKAFKRYVELQHSCIKYGVTVLMKYGVDYISINELTEKVKDTLETEKTWKPYFDKAEKILNEADRMVEYRNAKRATRSRWQGGGFGIGGAIKGALTAGAMNLATDAFRGIGDTISNSSDKAKISKMKRAVIEESGLLENLSNNFYYNTSSMFYDIWAILYEEDKLPYVETDTEKIEAQFQNYSEAYKRDKSYYKKIVDVLIEGIATDPFAGSFYTTLYSMVSENKNEISEIAEFFGLRNEYDNNIGWMREEMIEEIQRMPEDNVQEIEKKIEAFQELHKKDYGIQIKQYVFELNKKARTSDGMVFATIEEKDTYCVEKERYGNLIESLYKQNVWKNKDVFLENYAALKALGKPESAYWKKEYEPVLEWCEAMSNELNTLHMVCVIKVLQRLGDTADTADTLVAYGNKNFSKLQKYYNPLLELEKGEKEVLYILGYRDKQRVALIFTSRAIYYVEKVSIKFSFAQISSINYTSLYPERPVSEIASYQLCLKHGVILDLLMLFKGVGCANFKERSSFLKVMRECVNDIQGVSREVWEMPEDQAIKVKIDKAIEEKNFEFVWNEIEKRNAYAEYALETYYTTLCKGVTERERFKQLIYDIYVKMEDDEYLDARIYAMYLSCHMTYLFLIESDGEEADKKRVVEAIVQNLADKYETISPIVQKGIWGIKGLYHATKSMEEAIECLKKGVEFSHPKALVELAVCYIEGKGGLPKDKEKAIEYLKKASDLGYTRANEELEKLGDFSSMEQFSKETPKEESKENTETNWHICPLCGKKLATTTKFCNFCGHKQ